MATSGFRHQCFIDHGSPLGHIPMIAAVIKARLEQNHRCLYLNSEQMVAGLRSGLEEIGVDVARETENNSLAFSSHWNHLGDDQTFDVDRMIATLEDTLNQALQDGYAGLWTSGDIAWEFGPKRDFSQLLQYEMQLEDFMCTHEEISGVCLYHAGVLPPDAMQTGHEVHPSIFINEIQSRLNPAHTARRPVEPTTPTEDILEVSFPKDILKRAHSCADSQGITLEEFIQRAIAEKLSHGDQKPLKN
jgi:hypothetical protein